MHTVVEDPLLFSAFILSRYDPGFDHPYVKVTAWRDEWHARGAVGAHTVLGHACLSELL